MKKINVNELLCKLIIFFPISTVVQGLPGFDSVNKILIAAILILLVFKVFTNKNLKSNLPVLYFTIIVYFFSFLFTSGKLDSINNIFYFGLWILLFLWMKDNYNEFKNIIETRMMFIKKTIVLWNFIVFISLFFNVSYTHTWGSEKFFQSFSNGEHRFAGACIYIVALVWILAQKRQRKKELCWAILPVISIYMTGTRTYLGVILIFLLCIYYLLCKKKIWFYISIIPILILLILLIQVTPMGEKMSLTFQDGYWGFWGTLTSGRSIFWEADLKAFSELNILNQLVGNGYNFVYDVNENVVFVRIWAHNDIINILLNYGYIGTILYLYVFLKFSNRILKENNANKITKYGYYFIWFFNAMFNMVYTYICAFFALPFILYSLTEYNSKNIKGEKNENCCN